MLPSLSKPSAFRTPGTIDLVISNPVILLNEIARRYETSERILMEYVDNALDDAEVLYRQNNNAYPYPIEIDLTLDTAAAAVTIADNCRGMPRGVLERIVRSIGESDKRGQTWVNGRFGFGVHAFRAAAERICIKSKHELSSLHVLEFHREQLSGIKEARRSDEACHAARGTGTQVTISQFEREWFAAVTVDSIKQEIERHFERLLKRPNLCIRVGECGQPAQVCQAFDYQALGGTALEYSLSLSCQGELYPVELYLKVASQPLPEHGAGFFARGRRIAAVVEIKSFMRKSQYATALWGHPNLVGYVEVGEMVQPILNRDDFVRTRRRQMLYEAIVALEADIRLALQQVNQDERQSTLEQLEAVLAAALQTSLTETLGVPASGAPAHRPARVAFVERLADGERRVDFQDGVLQINMAHADFQQRLSLSRQGIPRLTDRLNAYLAQILMLYAGRTDAAGANQAGALEAQLARFVQLEENLRRQRTGLK